MEGRTHGAQVLVARGQLRLVPRVRPAAHEDLLAPLDPALCRRLAQVDLLSLVPARVRVEEDPGTWSDGGRVMTREKKKKVGRGETTEGTYCFSSALACSSGPPLARGTVMSAAQLRMCCPSSAHCRSVAHPSV